MHLDRQMSRFDTPYPSSAQLHIEQQVKLAVERKLSLFIRFDAGIGKRFLYNLLHSQIFSDSLLRNYFTKE